MGKYTPASKLVSNPSGRVNGLGLLVTSTKLACMNPSPMLAHRGLSGTADGTVFAGSKSAVGAPVSVGAGVSVGASALVAVGQLGSWRLGGNSGHGRCNSRLKIYRLTHPSVCRPMSIAERNVERLTLLKKVIIGPGRIAHSRKARRCQYPNLSAGRPG